MTTRTRHSLASHRHAISLAATLCVLGSASQAAAPAANALPEGGQVVAGQAGIGRSGPTLTITQGSSRAAIDWQRFDIGADAQVRFVQPGADSVTLNRVLGSQPSQIFGRLQSNGQVFLSNPSGVYFAPSARVDVGGLVASTHGIGNDDFMAGRDSLDRLGATGRIVNDGELRAALGGYIALLAPEVRNQGLVVAQGGTVALAAGERYRLQFSEPGALANVLVTPATVQALVDNGQAVQAPGGLIILSAQAASALRSGVVHNSGSLDASGLVHSGGRILLSASERIAHSGQISADASASTGQGGSVQLLAPSVLLDNGSTLSASGPSGGGTVLVGGDWQGGNDVAQARQVLMQPQARIQADATENGPGGQVVLWSTDWTGFYGQIQARGGPSGGAGGAVETSSKGKLQAFGRVQAGRWLLDPTDVTIDGDNAADPNVSVSNGSFTPTSNSARIAASAINAALDAGSDVTVSTASGGGAAGDITLAAGAGIVNTSGGARSLTLLADRNITLDGSISSPSGPLTTTLTAATGGLSGRGSVHTNGGMLTIDMLTGGRWDGSITGAGGLTKRGDGVLTMAGSSTYTGDTLIAQGALLGSADGGGGHLASQSAFTVDGGLAVQGRETIGSLNGAGALAFTKPGASLTVGADGRDGAFSGIIVDSWDPGVEARPAGSLVKVGAGTQTLSVTTATWGGVTDVQQGTLALASSNAISQDTSLHIGAAGTARLLAPQAVATLSGAGTLDLSAGLVIAGWQSSTFSGAIVGDLAGAAALVKYGPGTLTLSGPSSFRGDTYVNDGVLRIGHSQALGAADNQVMVSGSASLHLDNVEGLTQSLKFMVYPPDDPAAWRPALSVSGPSAISGPIDLGWGLDPVVVDVAAGGSLVHAGALVGGTPVVKSGAGSMTLSGDLSQSYGALQVRAGALHLSNSAGFGSTTAPVSVAAGAALQITHSDPDPAAAALTLSRPVTLEGGSTLSTAGKVAISGASVTLSAGPVGSHAPVIDVSGRLDIDAPLVQSEWQGLVKRGDGVLTLSQAGSYAGDTRVEAGSLATRGAARLSPDSSFSLAAGTSLVLDGDESLGSLSGSGTVVLAEASALTLGANGRSAVFSGEIAQNPGTAARLVKLGSGVQTLLGNNSYTGTTTVSAGTLQVGAGGNSGRLGSGAVVNDATLVMRRSDGAALDAHISGSGSLSVDVGADLSVHGSIEQGTVGLRAAGNLTLAPGSRVATSAGDVVLAAGGDFVNQAGASALSPAAGGRWIVYTRTPEAHAGFGGLVSGQSALWGRTVGSLMPEAVPAGNRYVFGSLGGSVTLAAGSAQKTYGEVVDLSGLSASEQYAGPAFQPDRYGSLFLATPRADILRGPVSFSSAGSDAPANAGSYDIVARGSAAPGFSVASAHGTLTVRPAEISISASRAYDGLTRFDLGSAAVDTRVIGARNGEVLRVVAGTASTAARQVGTEDAAVSGLVLRVDGGRGLASNYSLPSQARLQITPLELRGLSIEAASSFYGDPVVPGMVSFAASNKVAGDSLSVAVSVLGTDQSERLSSSGRPRVGSYQQAATALGGADAANYRFVPFTSASASYTITPRPLAVAAIEPGSSTYGLPLNLGAVQLANPVLAGDEVRTGVSLLDPTFSSSGQVNAGSYRQRVGITGGADAANYTVWPASPAAANYTVAPRVLTVGGIEPGGSTYGDELKLGPAQLTTAPLAGDRASPVVTLVDPRASSSGHVTVGHYDLTVRSMSGPDAGNYSLSPYTTTGGSYTVTPRALTVTDIAAARSTYGSAVTPGLASLDSQRMPGDAVSATVSLVEPVASASGQVNAGSYRQTAATLGGADAANYRFTPYTTASANYRVEPAPFTGISAGKTYDGHATLDTAVLTGVAGERFVARQAVADSANASSNPQRPATRIVDVQGPVSGNAGASLANYEALSPAVLAGLGSNSVQILPAALSITANDDIRLQDGQAYRGGNGLRYSGFVNGEGPAVLGGQLQYAGSSQGAVSPGHYLISPYGLSSGNYDIRFVDGLLRLVAPWALPPVADRSGATGAQRVALLASARAAVAELRMPADRGEEDEDFEPLLMATDGSP